MRKVVVGIVAALGIVLGSGSAAMAGEANGNGDPVPGGQNAHSECAYSGLDTADALEHNPTGFDDDALAMRGNQSPAGVHRYHGVQSYGAIVSAGGKDTSPAPGQACRGH